MWIGEAPGGGFVSFAFTPDGTTLYTGDDLGYVRVWNLQTRESRQLYELDRVYDRRQAVWQLALTPDATRLFIPTRAQIHVLDLPEGTPRHIHNTQWVVPCMSIPPDGRRIATASNEGNVVMWDAKTLKLRDVPGALGQVRDVVYVAFVENGARVLVLRSTGRELSIWNPETGAPVDLLSAGEVWCRTCALSADGRSFAACSANGLESRVFGPPDFSRRATIRHAKPIDSLAFNPTGELLAITDGTPNVTLWNTTSEKTAGTWNWRIGNVHSAAFAPDGLTCAVGGVSQFAVFDVDV